MEFTYACRNKNCSYPGKNNFGMTINEENVMDDKNMATIFCPFCKQEMVPHPPHGTHSIVNSDVPGHMH